LNRELFLQLPLTTNSGQIIQNTELFSAFCLQLPFIFSGNSIHVSCIQPLSFNASLARF